MGKVWDSEYPYESHENVNFNSRVLDTSNPGRNTVILEIMKRLKYTKADKSEVWIANGYKCLYHFSNVL